MKELVHHIDVCSFFRKGRVLSHEREKSLLLVLGNETLDSIKSESLDFGSGLGTLPSCVGCKLSSDFRPVSLGKSLLVLDQRLDSLELSGPSRVHRLGEVDLGLAGDTCDRISRDSIGLSGEIFGAYGLDTGCLDI